MSLINRYHAVLNSLKVTQKNKVLIAVSGGVDSMVLLRLSANVGLKIAAAHVNFKLRDDESNKDEAFVKEICQSLNIPLFSAIKPIDKNKENVQVAAREARYEWFDEVCDNENFDFVFTAHHQDDKIETFFMHLIRGSGIKGLRSIPQQTGRILRPLLDFSKEEIIAFAKENNVKWREDATNQETDYLRNKIRHGLAKDFSQLADFANQNLMRSIDYIQEAHLYFENQANRFIHSLEQRDELYFITDQKWNRLFEKKPLHKYVFDQFGFEAQQLAALEAFGESQTGKKMQSQIFKIYRDRNQFVIQPILEKQKVEIPIHTPQGELQKPIFLKWHSQKKAKSALHTQNHIAALALEKLKFPLLLRNWTSGDKFMPLGMKGKKKVSDFLTDLKLSIPEKEKVMVIESAGEICWIVGLRIDQRFKPEANSENILIIECSNKKK